MPSPLSPLRFRRGPEMKNRLALAPMTNQQSHPDGTLSDDEFHWLVMRAKGGFGLTMTCAAHVQAVGQGFEGQLGVFGDPHLPGLERLAAAIRAEGSLSFVQLHHAGRRSPAELVGQPVAPSDDPDKGARGLSLSEVEALRDDFIAAAVRSERAGFDGVEVHGAHGYVLTQFLSPKTNRRDDHYGGDLTGRARILFEILAGIRERCGDDFILGLRLSPERFGIALDEARELTRRVLPEVDFLEMSLWDTFKEPEDEAHRGRSLLSHFTDLDRGDTRLGVAGKLYSAADVRRALEEGADFVSLGRGALLHHDFPERMRADPDFTRVELPVSVDHLKREGLGDAFVEYMRRWEGFVEG
ncbi:MAG: NADH:flavin oxidoreductase [Sandaracinaceae bacterium]